jgi:hypothetical protein
MINDFMGLEKPGKVRLILFFLVLIWCIYWGAGFSYEISRGGGTFSGLSGNMVDTSSIDNVNIDGGDFTWAVRLLGWATNGAIMIVIVILMLLFMVLETVATIIPVVLLRIFGLNKKYEVTDGEYKLTKYIYLIAICLSLVLGLILTRFTGIIPDILFTLVWSLVALIYVLGTWERKKMYEAALQKGIPYEEYFNQIKNK